MLSRQGGDRVGGFGEMCGCSTAALDPSSPREVAGQGAVGEGGFSRGTVTHAPVLLGQEVRTGFTGSASSFRTPRWLL